MYASRRSKEGRGRLTGHRAWCRGAGGQCAARDSSSRWSPCHTACTCGAGLPCVSSCGAGGLCGKWTGDCIVSTRMAGRRCGEPCGLQPSMYLYELILTVCRAAYLNKIVFRNDLEGMATWMGGGVTLTLKSKHFILGLGTNVWRYLLFLVNPCWHEGIRTVWSCSIGKPNAWIN